MESALERGDGIGLWMVRWVVETHIGTTVDRGTTVAVRIPRPLATGQLPSRQLEDGAQTERWHADRRVR